LFDEFIDYHLLTILMLCEFIDYRCTDQAVKQSDAFVESPNGRKRRKETTKGWGLLVKWKNGSEAWIPLKDAKETFPVQVAEFAVQVRIQDEPAFAWWVPHVLKKRALIIRSKASIGNEHTSSEFEYPSVSRKH
jgi:hypothetical protein